MTCFKEVVLHSPPPTSCPGQPLASLLPWVQKQDNVLCFLTYILAAQHCIAGCAASPPPSCPLAGTCGAELEERGGSRWAGGVIGSDAANAMSVRWDLQSEFMVASKGETAGQPNCMLFWNKS